MWSLAAQMAHLWLPFVGLIFALFLSLRNPSWLVAGQGREDLLRRDIIPPQAQIIDQRNFNVLHNVLPPSEADGIAVCVEYAFILFLCDVAGLTSIYL
jgi:hypothetical protein